MAEQGLLTNAEAASAMGTQTPVTSTSTRGRHQGIAAVVSATTVSTTLRVSTVSAVNQVSTATSGDPSLPLMLAKRVPATQLDRRSFLSAR